MASFTEYPKMGDRFSSALQFAASAHQLQIRKQGEIPYISHLMTVSALVLEAGGDEEMAIAALLHDYIEDIDPEGFSKIKAMFGDRVASIVWLLSSDTNDGYLAQMHHAPDDLLIISAADKLHNLRGYSTTGRSLWKPHHRAFYESLLSIYKTCDRVPREWVDEMRMRLNDLP
jgi:(p)ppGpp synthase/HD superfamily hydrolase